jgi:hypothetical protein
MLIAAALFFSVALWGCGGAVEPSGSPSPTPARSVTAIPSTKDAQGNFNELSLRLVEVFVKDLSRAQREAMAAEIAAMPEVELYHFVDKAEALERFTKTFPDISMPTKNPLPASFEIVVRSGVDVPAFAKRFFDDARVDSSPGSHDGVQYSVQPEESASP